MWMMHLPWRSRARARQHERAAQQYQDQQRAEAFARITALAQQSWNAPTRYLPLPQIAPLITRGQADRAT